MSMQLWWQVVGVILFALIIFAPLYLPKPDKGGEKTYESDAEDCDSWVDSKT